MKDYLRASIEKVRIMYNFYPELGALTILLALGIVANAGVVLVLLSMINGGL